ncbi:MAG: ATP-binding cassette domain-containing protein [Lachnospiraceae bacterium]|nr:ATP-binding cassette domain-containing protein [Lachnospiraceae bacterium]
MKLVIKNVVKNLGGKRVLDQLFLKMDEGIYGLLGPNGAGKTTLFRCMVGLYEVNKGAIGIIDEVDGIIDLQPHDIGYLPQKFGIFKHMSVQEFMEYFAFVKKVDKDERKNEVERCLKLVNLEDKARNKIKTLSGGMVRRLGIAQALLGDPRFLLFDEPTTGLDPEERVRFKQIISKIALNKIVIISTHIVEDIDAICDKAIIIKNGQVVVSGAKEELIKKMKYHVYEIEEQEGEEVEEPFYDLRFSSRDGKVYRRIITKAQLPKQECKATLEDAYHEFIKCGNVEW